MLSTLVPAYRDYKTKKEVLAAFVADKDFKLETYNQSTYINKQDIEKLGEKEVMVRYSKLMKVTILKFSSKTNTWK